MNSTQYFLHDFLSEVIDDALELKRTAKDEFEQGKLMGYYEVISTALNQVQAFGITETLPEKIRRFVPESLLNP